MKDNLFVKNIKYLTKTRINQNQLANIFNVSRQAIGNLLKTKDPRASTLLKLSEIYNVSIDDLLKKDLESEQSEKEII